MVKKEKKVTRIDPVRTTQPLEQTQEKELVIGLIVRH